MIHPVKPISVMGDWCDKFRTNLPAGNPLDWEEKYDEIPTLGFGRKQLQFHEPFPDQEIFDYYDIKNIKDSQHYLYVITLVSPNYFTVTKDHGFDNINPIVLKDLKKGKCEIIYRFDMEGFFDYDSLLILQGWITKWEIDPKKVHFVHGNHLGDLIMEKKGLTFNYYSVDVFPCWSKIHRLLYEYEDPCPFEPIDDKNLYINLNRRIRWQRMLTLIHLNENNLIDRGNNSFRPDGGVEFYYDSLSHLKNTYDSPHHKEDDLFNLMERLFEKTPLVVDVTEDSNDLDDLYPLEIIKKSFLYLVTETHVDNTTLFISEKTYKPLILGVPFVVVGNMGTLKYLKDKGFKTFDRWWDESYDNEPDPEKRIIHVVGIIEKLSKLTTKELIDIRNEMNEVLVYNRKNYFKLIYTDYYSDFGIPPEFKSSDIMYMYKPTYRVFLDIWNSLGKSFQSSRISLNG